MAEQFNTKALADFIQEILEGERLSKLTQEDIFDLFKKWDNTSLTLTINWEEQVLSLWNFENPTKLQQHVRKLLKNVSNPIHSISEYLQPNYDMGDFHISSMEDISIPLKTILNSHQIESKEYDDIVKECNANDQLPIDKIFTPMPLLRSDYQDNMFTQHNDKFILIGSIQQDGNFTITHHNNKQIDENALRQLAQQNPTFLIKNLSYAKEENKPVDDNNSIL